MADADDAERPPVQVQRRQRGPEDDWRRCPVVFSPLIFFTFPFLFFDEPRHGDLRREVPQPQPAALPGVGPEGRLERGRGAAAAAAAAARARARARGAVEGAEGLGLDGGVAGDEGGVGREGLGGHGPDGDDDLVIGKRVGVERLRKKKG